MIKIIGVTQRVDYIDDYNQRRDSLDQNWHLFFSKINYFPIPLPNISRNIKEYLNQLNLNSILLSGGNSIASLDPTINDAAPERDAFEIALLSFALNKKLPVIGICRGMQVINYFLGGKLKKTDNQVNIYHKIRKITQNYHLPKKVNSYHKYVIPLKNISDQLTPLALDDDDNVEAFISKEKNILGLMWHPERDKPFDKKTIALISNFLK